MKRILALNQGFFFSSAAFLFTPTPHHYDVAVEATHKVPRNNWCGGLNVWRRIGGCYCKLKTTFATYALTKLDANMNIQ